MAGYIISCCSTCDLSAEHLASIDVSYLPFHFFLDGKEYPDDLGKSILDVSGVRRSVHGLFHRDR